MRAIWRDMLAGVAGVAIFAAIVGASGAAEPPKGPDSTEANEPSAETTADRLLKEAQSAGDAALAWFERQTGVSATEEVASAEERLRQAIAEAMNRAAVGREPVVRLLGPARAGDKAGFVRWEPLEKEEGEDEGAAAIPEELVLLVHGIDEPGGVWDDLAPALAAAGLNVARFDYPNDQPLARSAEMLAAALADLRARGVQRVDIVAHSAGGLITRDVLTRAAPGMYAGRPHGHAGLPDVEHFIMIGTPNRGAAIVRLRFIGEMREQFVRWIEADGNDPAALLGFLHDGSGEVADDLSPGSDYLKDLNARPLPPQGEDGVEITVIVGTVAEERTRTLAETLNLPLVRRVLSEEQIREAEAGLLELGETLGDGVVPVTSQVLEGVADTIYLEANHRSMLRRIAIPGVSEALRLDRAEPPAVRVVLERLKER